jgi:predicted kinase
MILLCGLPGAGKSTLARRLEADGKGVRLSTDEWQGALGVSHSDVAFHDRLQFLLYRHALTLLRHHVDVILEDGLWRAVEREEKFADVRAVGGHIEFHVFEVNYGTLWQRLQQQNQHGSTAAYPMTDDELRWAWSVFEPPSRDELASVDRHVVHGGGFD